MQPSADALEPEHIISHAHLPPPFRSNHSPGGHGRVRRSCGCAARRAGRCRDAGARQHPRAQAVSGARRCRSRTQERLQRIEKARRLMAENGIGAIVLETSTSMSYFVNVRWGLSERPFLLVIPQKGELAYVCPGFEEARAREFTTFTKDVRVWQEDEDWGATVHGHPEGPRRVDRRRSASRSASASSSPTASRRPRRPRRSCWPRR